MHLSIKIAKSGSEIMKEIEEKRMQIGPVEGAGYQLVFIDDSKVPKLDIRLTQLRTLMHSKREVFDHVNVATIFHQIGKFGITQPLRNTILHHAILKARFRLQRPKKEFCEGFVGLGDRYG